MKKRRIFSVGFGRGYVINKIWGSFIVVGIVYAFAVGNVEVINNEIIDSGNTSLELFFSMLPMMILWSGIMNIAKKAGILDFLARCMKPIFRVIFPDLKKDDPALGYIASNLTINMLGIHNASTPFGLKAMKCLQEKNRNKKVATRSMITFLVLNTSGVTVIATDIIAIRSSMGSVNPTDLVMVTIIATMINTTLALLMDRFLWKVSKKV
ncbi:MAG: nucleoside recognition domain-containing protein [bacterium]|nr:nucleoside recognition domain-containing protein [bacterium]